MRRNLVAGNWKMNGTQATAASLCAQILGGLDGIDRGGGVEVVLCPPHVLIPAATDVLAGSVVGVGAQDLDAHDNGPFTGQISAGMLVDSGCRFCLIGHSERRAQYFESDELTAQKTRAAVAAGLTPILCLGETLAERESGVTEGVVGRQLDAVLDGVGSETFAAGVIAYEPVWAIGTGVTATPAEAQAVHRFIRARLAARDASVADGCRILYGGSMKPENAAELLAEADIDGGLIGGAALNAADFLAIIDAAGPAKAA